MEDFNKVYFVSYIDSDGTHHYTAHWSEDSAQIDLYNDWINTEPNLTAELARDTWNTLMNTNGIPEFGEIEVATWSWTENKGELKI